MIDIALVWNRAAGRCEIVPIPGDLLADETLLTSVLLSLFTERGSWWGDMPIDASAGAAGPDDILGSDLTRILRNANQVPQTLLDVQAAVKLCLQWLITDGLARDIQAVAKFGPRGVIVISIAVIISPSQPPLLIQLGANADGLQSVQVTDSARNPQISF